MQALHCIFGAGALLGPLIVEPFLLDNNIDSHVSHAIYAMRIYEDCITVLVCTHSGKNKVE